VHKIGLILSGDSKSDKGSQPSRKSENLFNFLICTWKTLHPIIQQNSAITDSYKGTYKNLLQEYETQMLFKLNLDLELSEPKQE
jgi:hypothetical protein